MGMMRCRIAVSFLLCSALALTLPAVVGGQSLGDVARKTKAKKKSPQTKVWTNEDFPSGRRPSQPARPEGMQQTPEERSVEQLFAELDYAQAELKSWQDSLPEIQQGLDSLYERRGNADTDYDRDMLDEAIVAAEAEIAAAEETVKELQAQVDELEELTKGKQRPPPKPPEPEVEAEAGESTAAEEPPASD